MPKLVPVTTGAHKRSIWTTIGRIVDRVLFVGLCLVFLFIFVCGVFLAYLDLTGPHCGTAVMNPGDTCSTLTATSGRSTKRIEKLNPAGTPPAVLTLPGYRHRENVYTGVYDVDGMREEHRPWGLGGLAMATLPVLMLLSSWRQARRAKKTALQDSVENTECGSS